MKQLGRVARYQKELSKITGDKIFLFDRACGRITQNGRPIPPFVTWWSGRGAEIASSRVCEDYERLSRFPAKGTRFGFNADIPDEIIVWKNRFGNQSCGTVGKVISLTGFPAWGRACASQS